MLSAYHSLSLVQHAPLLIFFRMLHLHNENPLVEPTILVPSFPVGRAIISLRLMFAHDVLYLPVEALEQGCTELCATRLTDWSPQYKLAGRIGIIQAT